MLQLICVSSFLTAVLFFYLFLRYILENRQSISRIKKYISIEEMKEEKKKGRARDYKRGLNLMAKTIGSSKILEGYKNRVHARLESAHILLKPEEYIAICLLLMLFPGAISFAVTHSALYGFLVGICGWFIPGIILKRKIKKRIKDLNEQLGDAILLISNSIKAGYSFFQSVDIVVKEMPGPICEEFASLQREMSLGISTEKALENLAGRVDSDDLELIVTAVLIQRQVGGNLSEVLDNISSTIRERVKIKGEVRAMTAQGRMSGIIISVMPVALGGVISLINPEYIKPLFNHTIGIAILVFSGLMELTGILLIKKIVKIDM